MRGVSEREPRRPRSPARSPRLDSRSAAGLEGAVGSSVVRRRPPRPDPVALGVVAVGATGLRHPTGSRDPTRPERVAFGVVLLVARLDSPELDDVALGVVGLFPARDRATLDRHVALGVVGLALVVPLVRHLAPPSSVRPGAGDCARSVASRTRWGCAFAYIHREVGNN